MCWEVKYRGRLRRVECAEPGITARHSSEEWESRSRWRRVQHDRQIEFAGAEAMLLLYYVSF